MARPSRQLDRRLLDTGRALLAEVGCAGLSVRRLAEAADVNPGMFHYHFKSREAFLRALLQEIYDEMFARLTVAATAGLSARENLRAALLVVACFVRDHRRLLLRLVGDAVAGEKIAAEFLRANLPRHLKIVAALLRQATRVGELAPLPHGQLLGFTFGAVATPLLAGAVFEAGAIDGGAAGRGLVREALTDAAIAERIELALAALAPPLARSGSKKRKRNA
ncbi:MAG: TetR/AcrR family transcriptional regulator [Gammaproteobacteria bacterium]|nr:TetR/AcrR family transcriptional regulator [Gammaproteobacteria bacterium]